MGPIPSARLVTVSLLSGFLLACGAAGNDDPGPVESADTTSGVAGAGGASAGGANAGGSFAAGAGGSKPDSANGGGGGTAAMSMGGSSGAMGQGGSGHAGGTGGSGVAPACCANPPAALPAGAPALEPSVWKNVGPAEVPFGSQNVFTQGMAIDPCNPATLYLTVTGYNPSDFKILPGGLFKTTDAGSHWSKLGAFDSGLNLRIDPKNSQHLYFGNGVRGNAGFWVSTDGGATWTQPQGFKDVSKNSLGGDTDVYHVEPDPTDFNHVLLSFHWYWDGCSAGCNAGVIESFDGGNTWTVHPPKAEWAGAGGYDILFLFNPALGIGDSKTWLYGTQGKGYWRTTDSGTTWKQVTTNNMEHGGTTIYYTKEGVLYAAGSPSLMRSKDNGATWTTVGPSAGYLSILGDGKNLYTGRHGTTQVLTSPESDGLTWSPLGPQEFHEGPFELAFDATNGILYNASITAGMWALKTK